MICFGLLTTTSQRSMYRDIADEMFTQLPSISDIIASPSNFIRDFIASPVMPMV